MKSLSDFKKVVLSSQDKNELYLTEVELQEYIGARHKAIRMAETEMDATEEKGNLGVAQSLVGICRERQSEVGNWANKVNYNFRMAAKSVLAKETYQKIWELAQLTRNDAKDKKKELNANKLAS